MTTLALDRKSLARFARQVRPEFEAHLKRLVEIPSIGSDPERSADMERMADEAMALLEREGAQVRLIRTKGQPIVYGRFDLDPRYPTITVYNHLDVQPADEPQWRTPPFEMLVKGKRYIARGTTDDKGPALTALYGARAARQAGVEANIAFLWELEEEIGSPSFEAALRREARSLATDVVVVSDTQWVSRDRPVISAGLRGMALFSLGLETGETDQHSGSVGGAARNPLAELMAVVTDLFDPVTGRVKVPGFYSDVRRPTRAELEAFGDSGFDVARFKKDHALRSLRSEDPLDVMQRIWTRPTLEVHGMTGGWQGPGAKTVVPARAEVKLSCRLVPDQRPERIMKLLRQYVSKRHPDVRFTSMGSLGPYRGVTTGPHAEAVARALEFAFGKKPAFVREGGSIGAVLSMLGVLGPPIVFMGLSLPEHGYHAPNEFFDWDQAAGGMAAFARYFAEVASMG